MKHVALSSAALDSTAFDAAPDQSSDSRDDTRVPLARGRPAVQLEHDGKILPSSLVISRAHDDLAFAIMVALCFCIDRSKQNAKDRSKCKPFPASISSSLFFRLKLLDFGLERETQSEHCFHWYDQLTRSHPPSRDSVSSAIDRWTTRGDLFFAPGKQVALTLRVFNSRSVTCVLVHARNEQRGAILVRGAVSWKQARVARSAKRFHGVPSYLGRERRSPVRPASNHATLDTSLDPNLVSGTVSERHLPPSSSRVVTVSRATSRLWNFLALARKISKTRFYPRRNHRLSLRRVSRIWSDIINHSRSSYWRTSRRFARSCCNVFYL